MAEEKTRTDEKKESSKKNSEVMEKVSEKIDEAKATDKANEELAKESGITEPEGGLNKGEKTLSAIGYISFFCILPLVLKQKSKFCQFHGKQGLVLTICYLILSLFGLIHTLLSLIIGLLYIILIVLGIVNSVQGKLWKIPGVCIIAGKLDFD